MYLRRSYRQKEGKRHAYWALVESYRTARGPRQRVVAYLGELDEQGRLGVQRAAQPDVAPQADLFDRPANIANKRLAIQTAEVGLESLLVRRQHKQMRTDCILSSFVL